MLHGERKRGLKRSTLRDYRYTLDGHLLPAFGDQEIAAITWEAIERWHARYPRSRTAEKVLIVLGAIMRYAQRRELIATNPIENVERHPVRYSGDYDIYSRAEIDALIRATADDQDAAIFLTAALTGLRRGDVLALRWRDVDFPGQAIRVRANLSMANSSRRSPARSASCRWSTKSPDVSRHCEGGATAPAMTTPSSLPRLAATSTQAPCAAATPPRQSEPDCGRCRSIRYATSSAPWRSTRPRSFRSRRGWVIRTSKPPPAISTTAPKPATQRFSRTRSSPPPLAHHHGRPTQRRNPSERGRLIATPPARAATPRASRA